MRNWLTIEIELMNKSALIVMGIVFEGTAS